MSKIKIEIEIEISDKSGCNVPHIENKITKDGKSIYGKESDVELKVIDLYTMWFAVRAQKKELERNALSNDIDLTVIEKKLDKDEEENGGMPFDMIKAPIGKS